MKLEDLSVTPEATDAHVELPTDADMAKLAAELKKLVPDVNIAA